MNSGDETEIIEKILETKGIWLPTPLLREDFILDLNKALSKGSPIAVSKFFGKAAEEVEKDTNSSACTQFLQAISERDGFVLEGYDELVTTDDEKVIKFLVSHTTFYAEDFLSLSGPMYYLSHVLKELERIRDNMPNLISVTLFLYLFITLYEITLFEVDRRLYTYLLKNDKKGNEIKRFMGVERKEHNDHATAGVINKVLCCLEIIGHSNSSIFGDENGPKGIRNEIAHGNFFYDEEEEVITVGMKKYKIKEFLKQYYKLYCFLKRWIEVSTKTSISNIDINNIFKKAFKDLSHIFRKVERSGELKRRFQTHIITLKKETADKT